MPYFSDGESGDHFRLQSNGSSDERREAVHSRHMQSNKKGRLHRFTRTEEHTQVCRQINRLPLTLFIIYRDALNDLAIHFLTKLKIMTIKDVERDDVEFICKARDL